MKRIEKFNSIKNHQVIGKIYKKLSKDDILFCENFLKENGNLSNDAFAFKVNRLGLNGEKSKNINNIWALLIQSIWGLYEKN